MACRVSDWPAAGLPACLLSDEDVILPKIQFSGSCMMKIITELVHLAPQMTDWRKTIHRHPELAFNEHHTSALVAEQLKAAGLDPVQGVGGTGVVALIKGREPGPVIALRA